MLFFNWICIVVSFDWHHKTPNPNLKSNYNESLHFFLCHRLYFFTPPLIPALCCLFCTSPSVSLSLSLAHCAMSGWLCASGPVSVYPCRAEKPNLGHMQHQQYSPAHISTLCRFVQRRLSACLTFHVCKTNLSV